MNSNATFNAQSTVAYRNNVILNGGTVMSGAGNGGSRPVVMLEKVTADSSIRQELAAIDIGTAGVKTDLNGYTVNVYVKTSTYFRWFGSLDGVTGTLSITGDNAWSYFNDMTAEARGVNLKVDNTCSFNFSAAVYVHDFYAGNTTSQDGSGPINGLYVCGTYTPVGDYYYGCVMQTGSTLNLLNRSLPFNLSSSLQNFKNGTEDDSMKRRTVRFDAGATVTVKISSSAVSELPKEGLRVVSWDETNKPGNDVRFVTDGELGRKYKLSPKDDGLWLLRHRGLVIYVR